MAFVVASASLHDLLRGPRRDARVVVAGPAAVYLQLDHPHPDHPPLDHPPLDHPPLDRLDAATAPAAGGSPPRLVALLARDAVRVPLGVVTAVRRGEVPFAAAQVGAGATVGDGEIRLAGGTEGAGGPMGAGGAAGSGGGVYRPLRYWDPRVPRLGTALGTARVRRRADALTALAAGLPPDVVTHWRAAADPLAAALADPVPCPDALAAGVLGLAGLGPGLTPAGDDVLAGALVALVAAGDGRRGSALADQVTAALGRTTTVSAALLAEACHGRAVPEVTALLKALAGSGDLDAALARLALVGHTSGAALALGVRLALRALDHHELGRVA